MQDLASTLRHPGRGSLDVAQITAWQCLDVQILPLATAAI